METLKITSPAFKNGEWIPGLYSCHGQNINPPIEIDSIPENTVSLALIMEDPDAPNGTFDHWLIWNIDITNRIEENSLPGITGKNSSGKTGYHGPCPPDGTHRYFFYVFALDSALDLTVGAGKDVLQQAMEDHIIARGELMGKFSTP